MSSCKGPSLVACGKKVGSDMGVGRVQENQHGGGFVLTAN
jgi:hypothetical protein